MKPEEKLDKLFEEARGLPVPPLDKNEITSHISSRQPSGFKITKPPFHKIAIWSASAAAVAFITLTVIFLSPAEKKQVEKAMPGQDSLINDDRQPVAVNPAPVPATPPARSLPIKNLSTLYHVLRKPSQTFIIDTEKDTCLTCREGTILRIKAGSFIVEKTGKPVAGKVRFRVQEFYRLSDILAGGLTTEEKSGRLLETGGMLFTEASKDGKKCALAPGKQMTIEFAPAPKKPGMQLFTGIQNPHSITWKGDAGNDAQRAAGREGASPHNHVTQPRGIGGFLTYGDQFLIGDMLRKHRKYPEEAKKKGIEGTVRLSFTFTANGTLASLKLLQGVEKSLDEAAIKAVANLTEKQIRRVTGGRNTVFEDIGVDFYIGNRRPVYQDTAFARNFEKNLSDTFLSKASTTDLKRYVLSSSSERNVFNASALGYHNADRYINMPFTMISYEIKHAQDANVNIIFHSWKTVLSRWYTSDSTKFERLPKGEKITVVAFKTIHNRPAIAIKETTINGGGEELVFVPVTVNTLKSELKKLNSIFN